LKVLLVLRLVDAKESVKGGFLASGSSRGISSLSQRLTCSDDQSVLRDWFGEKAQIRKWRLLWVSIPTGDCQKCRMVQRSQVLQWFRVYLDDFDHSIDGHRSGQLQRELICLANQLLQFFGADPSSSPPLVDGLTCFDRICISVEDNLSQQDAIQLLTGGIKRSR
jgi:hypothetical protein